MFEDGERFYLKAKEVGIDVQFRAGRGMLHCYPLLSPMFKKAKNLFLAVVGKATVLAFSNLVFILFLFHAF